MKVNFQDLVDQLEVENKTKEKEQKQTERLATTVGANDAVQKAIIETTKILIKFLAEHKATVSVDNHPEPIETVKTPDVNKVVVAVASLEKTIKENHVTDENTVKAIGNLSKLIEKLPQQITIPETKIPDSITVKNQVDYSKELKALSDSIQKIDVRPEVTVEAPKVEVKTDSQEIISELKVLAEAFRNQKIEIPDTDIKPLIEATNKVADAVQNQQFPIPNYILPFKDINGKATQVQLDSSGNIPTSSASSSNTKYVTLIDDTTTTNVTYIGKALPTGSAIATSSAVWQITKIDESGSPTTIKYADGNTNLDNIWDNRTSLTYN